VTNRIEIKDKGFNRLMKTIKRTQPAVQVGVFGMHAASAHSKSKGVTQGQLADWFETGTRDHYSAPKQKTQSRSTEKSVKKSVKKQSLFGRIKKGVRKVGHDLKKAALAKPETPKVKQGMPARKWLSGYVDKNRVRIQKMLRVGAEAIIKGTETPESFFQKLGLQAVGEIQKRISDGIAPPNALLTIAQKKSSKPLIDTGQWRGNIASAVILRGKGVTK